MRVPVRACTHFPEHGACVHIALSYVRRHKGQLKKGVVTHTFRCDNSDEWVDRIDSLLQSMRTPKIN